MKKFLVVLFTILCFIPTILFADEGDKDLVKVYIFEAGGCPYCEAETEYLKGLESYGTKFEIVSKELYVDHVDWEKGSDYDLGVEVVKAFNKAGFSDASYTATPLVVISDLYAITGYNTDLESIIDEAYEQGDKDIVSCISNNGECTISGTSVETQSGSSNNGGLALVVVGIVALIAMFVYISKNRNNASEDKEEIEKNEEEKEKIVEEKSHEEKSKRNYKKQTTSNKASSNRTYTKRTTTKRTTSNNSNVRNNTKTKKSE